LIFWSYFPEFSNCGIMDSRYWMGKTDYLSINDETKGFIKDGHYCEMGNQVIADSMWGYINQSIM